MPCKLVSMYLCLDKYSTNKQQSSTQGGRYDFENGVAGFYFKGTGKLIFFCSLFSYFFQS